MTGTKELRDGLRHTTNIIWMTISSISELVDWKSQALPQSLGFEGRQDGRQRGEGFEPLRCGLKWWD